MTTLASEPILTSRLRRWTVQEYHRMAYPALFGPDERLELIEGEIVFRGTDIPRPFTDREQDQLWAMGLLRLGEEVPSAEGKGIPKMSPMGAPYATAIGKTGDALREIFQNGYIVREQFPSTVSKRSEPEPDVLIAAGSHDDYSDHHPDSSEALLVVEVSDSSLPQDRGKKASLYAKSGVSDYWIVNLANRTLEVRRQPQNGNYASLTVYSEDQSVAPLAAPNSPVLVARLLPLARPVRNEQPEGTTHA